MLLHGSYSLNIEVDLAGISPFLIGNTSSIRVHFPANYVRLPECNWKLLLSSFNWGQTKNKSWETHSHIYASHHSKKKIKKHFQSITSTKSHSELQPIPKTLNQFKKKAPRPSEFWLNLCQATSCSCEKIGTFNCTSGDSFRDKLWWCHFRVVFPGKPSPNPGDMLIFYIYIYIIGANCIENVF